MTSNQQYLRVLFDGTAFSLHRWSGISRYFAELIGQYRDDARLGVEALTPYRYTSNAHLATRPGFHAVPLPRSRRISVLNRLNRAALRRTDLTRSITHFPLYDAHLLPAARTSRSVTTVYDFTFEVHPELFGDASLHLAQKAEFFRACDALVCISETTRRDLARFHPDLDKPVVVTPLAVSDEFAARGSRRVRRLPNRYILHVGNRAEHKNLELVLKAFDELAARDHQLHLVLSGQGLPAERERISELRHCDRVHTIRLSERELPSAYRDAAAFFFPSYYEGFGLPLLEALTAGCPAVISDCPALLEVADGAAGVVGADDLDGAVAALDELINNPKVADRRRSLGLSRANDFSWRRTAERTVAAYRLARDHIQS